MSAYVCGVPRDSQGRPPLGWWRVAEAGGEARWFCSKTCLVNWLVADEVELTPWQAARILSAMNARPWHTMRDMTEHRLGVLLGRAFNGLVSAVREQAEQDGAGERVSVEDLIETFNEQNQRTA